MPDQFPKRIMMISTHGHVSASPEFGRADTGGQVVYVLEVAKRLARAGCQVDILTRRFGGRPEIEPVAAGVRVLAFRCGGEKFIPKEALCDHIPEWVDRAASFIRRERLRYDVINSHYWDGGLGGMTLAAMLDVPHVHTPHSLGAWKRDAMCGDPGELERTYNFRRRIRDERRIYAASDLIVATTHQQRGVLETPEYSVPLARIRVLPPGYDDARFSPVSPVERQSIRRRLGMHGPTVLALGRVARNKGFDLLVRAMPSVFSRVSDARLWLAIGSSCPNDEERGELSMLCQLARQVGIADRVEFRGHVADEELADHYRAADVFALSGRYEPFGMTAIEAMACGTPCVITTKGGLWDMVTWGRDAHCADPFSPDDFGRSIGQVLRDPAVAARLSVNGAAKVRSGFTWRNVAVGLANAYESAARRRAVGVRRAAHRPALALGGRESAA
ncbi:MAG TPA: glycosyltransferase [Pirellulales bacterium]|nr:glycosyltransferase [Pirellulales bacterium]